jgi:tetratricopeptide (TPR) repeat protein
MDVPRMAPPHMLRLCLLLLPLGLGAFWPSGSVIAESGSRAPASTAEPVGYKAAIDSAIEEFASNNLAEAREHFGRAHALFPNARTLRGLGMVEFELRNYPEAIGWLRKALAFDVKRLEGKLRGETEDLLERANGYVGEVRLRVSPSDASVPRLLRES